MVRAVSLVGTLIVVSVSSGRDLGAQERQGFWIALGVSPGIGTCTQVSSTAGNRRCSSDSKIGASGFVSAGGTIHDRVLLSLELNGWMHSNPDTVRQYGLGAGMVQVYPARHLPVFLKGGIGIGRYAEEREGEDALTAFGFAFELGVGADFGVAPRLTLAPFAQVVAAPNVRADLGLFQLEDPLDFTLVQVGAGVRWQ